MDVSVVRGSSVAALISAALLQTACGDRVETPAVAASQPPLAANVLPPARPWRFVKLVAVSEVQGRAWASIAELNLLDVNGAVMDRQGWIATASSEDVHDVAAQAIDGDPHSLWHSAWQGKDVPAPPHEFIVQLPAPVRVSGLRLLPRQDQVTNGTIAEYRVHGSTDGVTWSEPLATGNFASEATAPGERTVVFAQQAPNHAPVFDALPAQSTPVGQAASIQLAARDADDDTLHYTATGLPPGLGLSPRTGRITGTPLAAGSYAVAVTAEDRKGGLGRGQFNWAVVGDGPAGAPPTAAAPGEVRFVRLEQLSEVNGNPWASLAELTVLDDRGQPLDRQGWRASADSADASDMPQNAIDGDPATFWHTQWDGVSPKPPHSLIVDLGRPRRIHGFGVLPRQDAPTNGLIARYRFYTSVDGVHWGAPVSEGDFSAMGRPRSQKTVLLH